MKTAQHDVRASRHDERAPRNATDRPAIESRDDGPERRRAAGRGLGGIPVNVKSRLCTANAGNEHRAEGKHRDRSSDWLRVTRVYRSAWSREPLDRNPGGSLDRAARRIFI